MILRTSVLSLAASLSCVAALAQAPAQPGTEATSAGSNIAPEIYRNPNAQPQQIFYKWYVRGRAHYGKYVPRGVKQYVRINGQGMLVSDRPTNDSFTVLRPIRPATTDAAPAAAAAGQQPLPAGTITPERRCEIAQSNMKTINEKSQVFEEDSSGNLIPLSADEISKRRQQAQSEIDAFCSPRPGSPSTGNRPPAAGSRPGPGALPPAAAPGRGTPMPPSGNAGDGKGLG